MLRSFYRDRLLLVLHDLGPTGESILRKRSSMMQSAVFALGVLFAFAAGGAIEQPVEEAVADSRGGGRTSKTWADGGV